jgi:hypothetical protein
MYIIETNNERQSWQWQPKQRILKTNDADWL